jgi:hypothetical protein
MSRKRKVVVENMVKVRVIGPDCWLGDRRILPGETANIPADLALEWIDTGRAVYGAAEEHIWLPEEL